MSNQQSKSMQEKAHYKRYIRQLDYEPTLDERVEFPESDKTDKEYSVSTLPPARRETILESLGEHLKENWLAWLIGIFAVVLVFLMVESKVDIAKIFEKTETIKENVNDLEDDIEKLKEKDHEQDLEIQEVKIKSENIENRIDLQNK